MKIYKYIVNVMRSYKILAILNFSWVAEDNLISLIALPPNYKIVMLNFGISTVPLMGKYYAGIILCMRPANERWRYIVTSFLIDWAHT